MVYPCKDCEDREVGCHSFCEKYKEAKKMDNRIKWRGRIRSEYARYSFFRYKDRIARGGK
jgi:hypothetical protein